jgi:hypothetical protein
VSEISDTALCFVPEAARDRVDIVLVRGLNLGLHGCGLRIAGDAQLGQLAVTDEGCACVLGGCLPRVAVGRDEEGGLVAVGGAQGVSNAHMA